MSLKNARGEDLEKLLAQSTAREKELREKIHEQRLEIDQANAVGTELRKRVSKAEGAESRWKDLAYSHNASRVALEGRVRELEAELSNATDPEQGPARQVLEQTLNERDAAHQILERLRAVNSQLLATRHNAESELAHLRERVAKALAALDSVRGYHLIKPSPARKYQEAVTVALEALRGE